MFLKICERLFDIRKEQHVRRIYCFSEAERLYLCSRFPNPGAGANTEYKPELPVQQDAWSCAVHIGRSNQTEEDIVCQYPTGSAVYTGEIPKILAETNE